MIIDPTWEEFSVCRIQCKYINTLSSQVTNVAETLGLGKKTPMGIVLDEFGIEPEVKYM